MPGAARIQIQRLCVMGPAEPHHTGFVRGFRARPVRHRRQSVGEGRNRAVSRTSGCRSLHHAVPVARAAAAAGAELDPTPRRDFRIVGIRRGTSSMSLTVARGLALEIAERIDTLPRVTVSRFFSGAGLVADGVQFGFVMKGSLY